MRILIVEDEPDLLDALKKQLQSSGYSVDGCGNGLDAEDYLKMATYDAVVLDIMLPGIDGLTLLKKMRAEGNTTHVLLLTALDSIENKVNGLDAGADDYLVKPFAYDELLARLRVLLRRRSGQTTVRPHGRSAPVQSAAQGPVHQNIWQSRRCHRLPPAHSNPFAAANCAVRSLPVPGMQNSCRSHFCSHGLCRVSAPHHGAECRSDSPVVCNIPRFSAQR